MNRVVIYSFEKMDAGVHVGKILVTKPPSKPPRFRVWELAKGYKLPTVYTGHFFEGGASYSIEVYVPEEQAKLGFDHWPEALKAIKARWPDAEIVYWDASGIVEPGAYADAQ